MSRSRAGVLPHERGPAREQRIRWPCSRRCQKQTEKLVHIEMRVSILFRSSTIYSPINSYIIVSLGSNLATSYQLEIFNDLHLFISVKIPCLLCDRHEAQSWLQGAESTPWVTHRRVTIDGRPRTTRKPRPIFVSKPSHVVWWNCLVPWRHLIHFDKIWSMCQVRRGTHTTEALCRVSRTCN